MAALLDDDLLNRPDPEWWIEGILAKDTETETEITSDSGLGKTFLCIHMTRCMASVMPFLGRKVTNAKTLYVIAEGAGAFGQRVRAWNDAHKHGAPAGVPSGSIQYLEKGENLSIKKSVDELERSSVPVILTSWSLTPSLS